MLSLRTRQGQGQGLTSLGPVSFVILASDLLPVYTSNVLVKFAEDIFVSVAAVNSDRRTDTMGRVQ